MYVRTRVRSMPDLNGKKIKWARFQPAKMNKKTIVDIQYIPKKDLPVFSLHLLQIFHLPPILAGWRNMCSGQTETLRIFFWNAL